MTPPPRTPPAADPGGEAGLGEFELIDRYFAPLAKAPGALGLQDDAAILQAPPGEDLIVTCDALVEGVHFLPDDPPESIGHKALAVNFSDLAAKGAAPLGYLLALSLPDPPSKDWLAGFARGLHALQQEIGTSLLGGDTTATPGPLTIAVTALGAVPAAGAVLRRGAVPGDRIFVSGTIGDAGLGLRLLREPGLAERWKMTEGQRSFLIDRFRRPQARTDLIKTLRAHAHAAIDLSDGLAGDLEKLGCR
jgi:thiamine-monophosphate kinase